MEREPIFWTTTQPGYNNVDRQREFIGEDGELVRERFPQRGHDGDYDDHRPYPRGERFKTMVRHEGHVVPVVMTSAAADLDPTTSFGQFQMAGARFHGWYTLGECPLALILNGSISERHLADKTLVGQEPCKHGTYSEANPCKHAQAELEARRKRNAKREAERENAYKNDTQKLIDANRADNAALAEALTKALQMAASGAAAAPAKAAGK